MRFFDQAPPNKLKNIVTRTFKQKETRYDEQNLSEPIPVLWFVEENVAGLNKSKYFSKNIKSAVSSKPTVDLW